MVSGVLPCYQCCAQDSDRPDTELPDPVAKAIVALPGQALLVLPLVVPHGNALLAVAAGNAACPAVALHLLPEGQRLDACHLMDQSIHRLHLQKTPGNKF